VNLSLQIDCFHTHAIKPVSVGLIFAEKTFRLLHRQSDFSYHEGFLTPSPSLPAQFIRLSAQTQTLELHFTRFENLYAAPHDIPDNEPLCAGMPSTCTDRGTQILSPPHRFTHQRHSPLLIRVSLRMRSIGLHKSRHLYNRSRTASHMPAAHNTSCSRRVPAAVNALCARKLLVWTRGGHPLSRRYENKLGYGKDVKNKLYLWNLCSRGFSPSTRVRKQIE